MHSVRRTRIHTHICTMYTYVCVYVCTLYMGGECYLLVSTITN